MYLDFYGLEKEPFNITPDPEFLFLTPSHREALATIIYGIEQRKGFIAITGEVGVGKTTILRSYLESIRPKGAEASYMYNGKYYMIRHTGDQHQLRTVYIFNANVSFQGLLKLIYRELELPLETDDVFEMVSNLHEMLIEEYKEDRNVVLIIDEAQNIPVETLENLRMLSNLETSKDKLIQIVLVGQPEFDRMLERDELRQLKQRIAIRSRIEPLTAKESFSYIEHRLVEAGGTRPVFSKSAMKAIVRNARGIPRTINILCDNSMITGFGYQKWPIGARIVKEVIADLNGKRGRKGFSWKKWASAFAIVGLVLLFWLSPYRITLQRLVTHSIQNQIDLNSPGPGNPSKEPNSPPPLMKEQVSSRPPAGKAGMQKGPGSDVRREAPTATPSILSSKPEAEREPPLRKEIPEVEKTLPAYAESEDKAQKSPSTELPAGRSEPVPLAGHLESADSSVQEPEPTSPADYSNRLAAEPALKQRGSPQEGTEPPPTKREDLPPAPVLRSTAEAARTSTRTEDNAASAPSASDHAAVARKTSVTTMVVKHGDYLSSLAKEVYGTVDDEIIAILRQANPQLSNVNVIRPGQRIHFPDLATVPKANE